MPGLHLVVILCCHFLHKLKLERFQFQFRFVSQISSDAYTIQAFVAVAEE